MANDPKNPLPGELSIDASELNGVVVDLVAGAMQGLRREQEGFGEVVAEIVANQALYGGRAGITDEDVRTFLGSNDDIARVRKFRGPVAKLNELLEETEAALDDRRHKQISAFATAIEQRAKTPGNEDLLARYQQLREYRSAPAVKGVKTRQKNARNGDPVPPQPGISTSTSTSPGDTGAVK